VEGNIIQNNGHGIKFTESDSYVKRNQIYNNLFNNTQNINLAGTSYINTWNATKTASTNIIDAATIGLNWGEIA
jgi:hypothetical protein